MQTIHTLQTKLRLVFNQITPIFRNQKKGKKKKKKSSVPGRKNPIVRGRVIPHVWSKQAPEATYNPL